MSQPVRDSDAPIRSKGRGCSGIVGALVTLIIAAAIFSGPRLVRVLGGLSTASQMRESVEAIASGPVIQQVEISGVYMNGVKLPNEPLEISVDMIGVDTDTNGRGWSDAIRDQAISEMTALTRGRKITIEFDVIRTQGVGNWPHLLAWIWADDTLLNAEMVKLGYVFVGDFGPNVKYQDLVLKAQDEAASSGAGRWSD